MLAPCPDCLSAVLVFRKINSSTSAVSSTSWAVDTDPTGERSRFNVASCVIHESRGQYIQRSTAVFAYRGEERR